MSYGYLVPSGLLCLVLYRPGMFAEVTTFPLQFWLILGFIVVMLTVFANLAFSWALSKVDAGQAAISTYLIPPTSLFYAWFFLRETIGIITILGAVLVIGGVFVANLANSERPV